MVFRLCFEKHCFSWYPLRDWTVVFFFFYPFLLFPPLCMMNKQLKTEHVNLTFLAFFLRLLYEQKHTGVCTSFGSTSLIDPPSYIGHPSSIAASISWGVSAAPQPSWEPLSLAHLVRFPAGSAAAAYLGPVPHLTSTLHTVNVPLFTPFLMEGRT